METIGGSAGRGKSLQDLRVQSGFVVQSGAALPSPTAAVGERREPRPIGSAYEGRNQSGTEVN